MEEISQHSELLNIFCNQRSCNFSHHTIPNFKTKTMGDGGSDRILGDGEGLIVALI